MPRGIHINARKENERGARQLEAGNKVKVSWISFHVQTNL